MHTIGIPMIKLYINIHQRTIYSGDRYYLRRGDMIFLKCYEFNLGFKLWLRHAFLIETGNVIHRHSA